jgi:hypothetical protein
MKIRMKTKTAGSKLATIIHTGKGLFSPRGLMTQPRLSGAVTENPLGTFSFCRADSRIMGRVDTESTPRKRLGVCPA